MLKIPVLLYHDVASEPRADLRRFTSSPEEFERHVDVVSSCGRTSLTVSELAEYLRADPRVERDVLAVTFDDGFASTLEAALALRRRGVKSTVYITTGEIGAPGMLTAEQIRELGGYDEVEIGPHTISHPHLDELTEREIEEEVSRSKSVLEAVLGRSVETFAYPHGAYDQRVRAAVVRAGYQSAAAVKNALSHPDDDPFAIARWTVTARTSENRLASVLSGDDVPVAWSKERRRTRASRVARRHRRRLQAWFERSSP